MPTIMHAEQVIYTWLEQNKPPITQLYTIDQLRDKRKQLLKDRPELVNDLSVARIEHLKQLATETGDNHDWVEEAFQVFYRARQQVTLFDDVIPVLECLKQSYTLVALTNGNAHISHTGLSEYFSFQVSAADVGAAKPDPAMFHKAMQLAEIDARQCLHVGDHPVHDIQGAHNAGIDSVWIRRLEQAWDASVEPPLKQFGNLQQLQGWLQDHN